MKQSKTIRHSCSIVSFQVSIPVYACLVVWEITGFGQRDLSELQIKQWSREKLVATDKLLTLISFLIGVASLLKSNMAFSEEKRNRTKSVNTNWLVHCHTRILWRRHLGHGCLVWLFIVISHALEGNKFSLCGNLFWME